jgi:amidase
MLARVADVLLVDTDAVDVPARLTRCAEAFAARAASEPEDSARLSAAAIDEASVFAGEQALWLHCYQQLQDDAIRASLGGWISSTSPRFGPSIASRFDRLQKLDDAEVARCRELRKTLAERIDTLVNATVIVQPTTPLALIEKDASDERIGAFYRDALTMNSIAALAGLPQVTVPLGDDRDRPLALSFIGPRGSDRALIALARSLFPSIQ